jgi:hypothetical protein
MLSAQAPDRIPSAVTRPSRRMRARRLFLTEITFLSLLAILLAGFEIGIRQVSPDAVQVSEYTGDIGVPSATRHITDARIVADLHTRINNLPTVW